MRILLHLFLKCISHKYFNHCLNENFVCFYLNTLNHAKPYQQMAENKTKTKTDNKINKLTLFDK